MVEVGNSSSNSHHSRGHSYNSNQTQMCNNAYCDCGIKAPLRTSHSNANPGRRFLGCANYQDERRACNFFVWIDPPTCPRELNYGRTLLNKIEDAEEEEEKLKSKSVIANLEIDKEKMMKKMDRLAKKNQLLKKKNEMLMIANVVSMALLGVFFVLWLANGK